MFVHYFICILQVSLFMHVFVYFYVLLFIYLLVCLFVSVSLIDHDLNSDKLSFDIVQGEM